MGKFVSLKVSEICDIYSKTLLVGNLNKDDVYIVLPGRHYLPYFEAALEEMSDKINVLYATPKFYNTYPSHRGEREPVNRAFIFELKQDAETSNGDSSVSKM